MEYVGLDASKLSVVAIWKDEKGNKLREEEFLNNDEGLAALASKLKGCEAVVESSCSGLNVYRHISKHASIVMAHPAKIRLITESGKKTDSNDAEILADLLRVGMLPLSYVPDDAIREQRDIVRHRKGLVNANVALKNRIRSILTREGLNCPYKRMLGAKSKKWLKDAPLTAMQKEAALQILSVSDMINSEIKKLDKKIEEEFDASPEAKLIDTMPGISKLSAIVIMSEIGEIKRFRKPENLISYAGLAPRVYQSGQTLHMGKIKPGSRLLRSILVQDANAAIRGCKRFRKFYMKLKRKKNHNKAVIAVARKMLKILWFMLQRNTPFEGEEALCATRGGAS